MPIPTASGGMRSLPKRTQHRIEDDQPDAHDRADAEHLPVERAADHALGEGRDERCLWSGEGMWRENADVRGAGKTVCLRQEVEDKRNHRRAGGDADDEGDLLTHRAEAPTSWPVFKSCKLSFEIVAQAKTIAVMNREKATSALRLSAVGATATTSSDAQSTIDRMPTPEIGLFDAPIVPPCNRRCRR